VKIAILGSAEATRDLAPFDDPTWEIWGLAWRFYDHPRMDKAFEVHDPSIWHEYVKPEIYQGWLNNPQDSDGNDVEVYMLPHVAETFPSKNIKAYPADEACKLMGRRYFTSSFSYMLAKAIMDGATEIGIWGVDLVTDEEYMQQRPAAEFLLGIAHARGIKITIPEQSALLKASHVYGLEDIRFGDPMEERYKQKEKEYRDKIEELKSQIFTLEGAAHECKEFYHALQAKRRGLWGK